MSAASKHRTLAFASLLAGLVLAAVTPAGGATKRDKLPPSSPTNVLVTNATTSSVSVAWDASTDNVAVSGYEVSGEVRRTRVKSTASTADRLSCGESFAIWVTALDRAGNRSTPAVATVATAPCLDTTPPSVPSGFRQAATSQDAVVLEWDPAVDNTGVVGYGVYQAGVPLTTTGEPAVTLSKLTCGSTYEVAVDAFDAAGNRSQRRTTWVTTSACSTPPSPGDTTPPSQPTSLAVSGATHTSVSLTWAAATDNVGVTGYGVYRGSTLVTNVTQPGASVSGLTCGTAYTFQVDAYDAAGNRSSKASVTGTTTACADTQAPTTPTNIVATNRTATSIALAWTASTDNVGVVGYGLYRGNSLVGTSPTNSGIVSGLTCNTSYTLSVDSYDAAGNRSSKSTVAVATTACPDTTAPSAPTGLSVSGVSQTGANLSWSASTDNVGVAGYDLHVQNASAGATTGTTYAFGNLTCGTSYTLGVAAFDAAGNRSSQSVTSVQTNACTVSAISQYPASYYAGPLGSRNPVPQKQGAFLITWIGMPGGATTWAQYKERILKRETDMGRKYDGIMVTDFKDQGEWADDRLKWVNDHGSIAIVAGLNFGKTISQINAGEADALIDAYADRYKAYGFTIMIRLHHEFNYGHLAYTSVGQESAFVAAWQRIVNRFQARGAANVGFWWSPAEGGTSAERASADAAYPGDSYVDWVGTDTYNHCYVGESGCYSTPYQDGWADFGLLFNYGTASRHDTYGPRKPFIVGETGTVWDPNAATKKGDWFSNIPDAAKNMKYLAGISFFDIDATPWESSRNNWIVDYPTNVPEVYQGFISMARNPWFNTRS